jgi:uncharacterized protein YqgV (UPF0045/DUF77 family)
MRSYLAILLISLISCNTIITDNSKIESLKLFFSKEVHLKDLVEYYVGFSLKLMSIFFNSLLDFYQQEKYKEYIEQLKKYLELLKEYLKKHSVKESLTKFSDLVKQLQDFVKNVSTEELAEYIKEVLEKIKDIVLNFDFGSFETYVAPLKKILKEIDPTEIAKKIAELLNQYKGEITDFDVDSFVNELLKEIKHFKDEVFSPELEKEIIESVKRDIKDLKNILDDSSDLLVELVQKILSMLYSDIKQTDLTEIYNYINSYYSIVRMFFLFFDPKNIVDIIRKALIKTKELAEKIDAEVVYEFFKKNIEYFRFLLGDYYTEILLKIALQIKEEIKGLSGKIDVDDICNKLTDLINLVKNFILSHDSQYIINEIKDAYDYIVELTDKYNINVVGEITKDYLDKLFDALKKFDEQLLVDLVQEVLNLIKAFIGENNKKFLGF